MLAIPKIVDRCIKGLLDLFFPSICVGCNHKLVQGETLICTFCLSSFPETDYHMLLDNPMTNRVMGETTITYGFALYSLRKKSVLERVLEAMKYQNQPKIGTLLGSYYGHILDKTALIKNVEAIIPIPLHHKRLRERGYNQSDFFAQGLSEVLQIPYYTACVERIRYTPSQTKKSKEARKTNLQNAFHVTKPHLISGKHLLVVDDILTTGATLVSCTKALLQQGAGQVSIATIAIVEA